MKQIRILVAVMLVALMSACSNDSDFMKYVANDHLMVASISPKQLMESAGCKVTSGKIEPSAIVQKVLASDPQVAEFMNNPYIDTDRVFVLADEGAGMDPDITFIMRITDKDAFTNLFKDKAEKVEKGDITVYQTYGTSIVIDGDIAFVCTTNTPDDAVKHIDDLAERAAKDPLPDKMAEKLNDKDHAAAAVIRVEKMMQMISRMGDIKMALVMAPISSAAPEVASGYVLSTAKLESNELEWDSEIFTAEGKQYKNDKANTKPDTDLLKYANAADYVALMIALPDLGLQSNSQLSLKDALDNPMVLATSFISDANTIMLAAGANNLASGILPGAYHVVTAIKMKKGKAEQYFTMLTTLAGPDAQPAADGSVKMRLDSNTTGYAKRFGDVIVLSVGSPITENGGSGIKSGDFGKGAVQFVARVPKGTLPVPFGIDIDAKIDSKGMESETKLVGTDKPFIETIMEAFN